MPFTMGLDIGTSNIKVIIFDTDVGKISDSSHCPTPIYHPLPEQSEHNPELLWQVIASVIRGIAYKFDIKAIGISSFAEAGLPLNSDFEAIYPIIAWHDRRTMPLVKEIKSKISEQEIFSITGQKVGFSFGLLKILWLKKHHPEIFDNTAKWVSVPDYIHFKLSGQLATDYTQASRTLMFDQSKKEWSKRLMQIVGFSSRQLPEIYPSGTAIGSITKSAIEITGLNKKTLCVLGGHDHLCGAYACGGSTPEEMIDSMGTSQALIAFSSNFKPSKKILDAGYVHYAHVTPRKYLYKGGLKAAGKILSWSEKVFKHSVKLYDEAALSGYSPDLPYWLPSFHGSGTPFRQPQAQAVLFGLNPNHTGEDISLALLESFAFWLRLNFDLMTKITEHTPKKLIAIGGANQNKALQLFKASIINKIIMIPNTPEASAVGAALLAAVGCGIASSIQDGMKLNAYPLELIHPNKNISTIINDRYFNEYLPMRRRMRANI